MKKISNTSFAFGIVIPNFASKTAKHRKECIFPIGKINLNMIKRGKRVTALSLSVMLMLNMTATALPVSAAAGESKTYTYDGYTVEYTVMGEWAGNQNIQVTITNTSDEVLSNWAVGYNARGEINGLWNAQVYGHQGTEYILSGASYNCEIEPGQSTNFGYILTGDNFKIPQNIYNCAERVDITDGYNVYYNITGDYGDTYQAEMVIENLSDTDINAWQLSFDGNATIDNLWNGKLIENENGSFKVKNAEHNVVIGAGNSTSFNFSGTKLAEETGFDAVETSALVTEPVVETTAVTDVSEDAFTDVSETDIAASENDTEAVSESETVTETEISVETEIVTETEAITETTTVFEQEIETNAEVIFDNFKLTSIVIPMEFDFEIDPEMDSDEDGLPDYIEKEIGSDRYNPDTDSDKLPDGYEYFMLGTYPIKEDSDDNTISDADEDFDEDNLSNLEEYNLGTDPFSKDSDYDNLSDYDEVNIHNTDPTEPDSDTDKVSDGDEIELGLDPNNPATNGYPDNEYTTEQTVGEDSEALDYINNIEDNPYTVSVEITAAGVAENNLSAGESGYSYSILQNDAVLGVVPVLSYSAGLSVTDVIINFNIDANQTDTSIDNLMVFKYFEDTNMLLPIETTYNETTNTVSTHVDEVGTYCLIDVEKWLGILEETPAGNYYEGGENEPANIVFCLDTRSVIDEESFNAVKADIKAITENAFDRYSDIKVYVYYQQFGSDFKATNKLLTDSNGNNYFTGYEEAVAALDKLETYMIKNNYWAYDFVEATQFMIDNCDEKIIAMYHITADDRVMGGINKAKKLAQTVQNSKYTTAEGKEIQRIYVSTLCPNDAEPFDTSSYAYELATLSGGIAVTGYDANEDTEVMTVEVESVEVYANDNEKIEVVNDDINESLIAILGEGNEGVYKIISSAGLTTIKLDKPLTYGSDEDYDEDGLSDWDEVNTTLIYNMYAKYNHSYPNVIKSSYLPTLADCNDYYKNSDSQKVYVERGYEIFINKNAGMYYQGDKEKAYAELSKLKILPINSNPSEPDTDGDGFYDGITGRYKPIGYYQVEDKWPLTDKPHQAFYQKKGQYYFKSLTFPETEVGGFTDGYDAHELNLTEEDQDYIYKLCIIANENTEAPKTDPLLVMSICAHETGCNELVNSYGYCGYMQFYYGYSNNYYKGQYYKNTVKKIVDTMLEDGYITSSELEILEQSNDEYRHQKEDIIKRKYIGITFGVALLRQCLSDKGDLWEGLRYYCWTGDTHSAYEDYYYRNTLSKLIDVECIYEEKYKCVANYYIIINGINVWL